MTSVRPRLLAAVPLFGLLLALGSTPALGSLPDSCNGYVDVALGTPKADVSSAADAGTVTLVFGPEGSGFGNPADRTIDETDLGGTPAAGNRFGASVVWGFEDADPHCSMVAIGAPGADAGAGKVYVFVVDEDGIVSDSIRVLTQGANGIADTAEAGDGFGSSLLFGGELFVSWLAVGSPNEDIGSATDAGMVHVLPYPGWGAGSVSYQQGSGGVPGAPETGDHFGAAIGPGRNVWSLWVGVTRGGPRQHRRCRRDRHPSGQPNDSGVVKLPGTVGAIKALSQDSAGVPGKAEAHDHFGAVLTALPGTENTDRAPIVGIPGENIGKVKDAGTIQVNYQDGTWATFQQGKGGVNGSPEKGDRFGASLSVSVDVVLIGVPGEDIGSTVNAGGVHRMTASGAIPKLSGSREESVSQSTAGVPGASEAGDKWGSAVAFSVSGAVIGAPGEDVDVYANAGSLTFIPWNPTTMKSLDPAHSLGFLAGDPGFPGALEVGAAFGTTAYSIAQ